MSVEGLRSAHKDPVGTPLDDAIDPVPIVEEALDVHKRSVVRGRVRVSTQVETTERLLREDLLTERAVVSRVRVDRVLAKDEPVPAVRTEGSTTIIPVLDEILVVERRLVLREEVRIEGSAEARRVEIPIALRRQRAVIERVSTEGRVTPVDSEVEDHHIMTHTITALFDEEAKARIAMDDLIEAGVPRTHVRLIPGAPDTVGALRAPYDHYKDEGGFWAALKSIFMPDEDRYTYSEGLSRGGTMLSVDAGQGDRERISDLLERSGAVNLDQREADWRQGGWPGYPGATAGRAPSSFAAPSTAAADHLAIGREEATDANGSLLKSVGQKIERALGADGAAQGADYIPVVEERLDVGKRTVDHGRVRLRSYVIETPVEKQVSLHDEVVHVDRRKVDRPVSATEADPFIERTVEIDERGEEVVVNKEARVVEEIGLRKEGVDRTETVSDRLRRTEVEIEDERRGGVSSPVADRP